MSDLARTSITLPAALLARARVAAGQANKMLSQLVEFVIDRGVTEIERNPRLVERFPANRRGNGGSAPRTKRA